MLPATRPAEGHGRMNEAGSANHTPGAVRELLGHLRPGPARHVRGFEDDARNYGPLNRRPLGLRTVPLDRIVGSVGRARELGPDFLPAGGRWKRQRRGRYQRILDAMRQGEILPPVELYKLGYNYYVLDGNHRVAAMKEITGNDGEIDAQVTQFLPAGDTEAARVYLERRAFEEATGLKQIGAAERGHYPVLLEEIERFRAEVSAATARAAPLREAANDWFITVWLPRAEQIRRAGLRRRWPEKRTADIYCYIREHQAAESARLGRPLTWDEALASFRARGLATSPRGQSRPRRLLNLAVPFRPGRSTAPPLPHPDDALDPERTS